MIVQLTDAELKKVKEFCIKVQAARRQRDRCNNDSGPHRLAREILGKASEIVISNILQIGTVDFQIYKNGQVHLRCKYDLVEHLHIKTCHLKYVDTKYDGWLINAKDQVTIKPSDKDVFIFCRANEQGEVHILGWAKAKDLTKFLKLPINRRLTHKLAYYYQDIAPFIKDLESFPL